MNKIQNKLAESNKTTLKISADFVDPLSRLMLRPAGANKPTTTSAAASTVATSPAPSNSSAAAIKTKEDIEQAESKKAEGEEP